MITQRRHYQDPPIVSTPLDDDFAVIVPKARTNEISNPSGETNTTGYTAGAGSLARSTAQQYHGAYSLAYTPSVSRTDGFYYTFTSTIALRAVSCKFLGVKNKPYAIAYATTAPAELATFSFYGTGRWQWVWLYYDERSAASRRIYFRKDGGTDLTTFYVDGVQSEVLSTAADRVSTYIDGDQQGLLPNQNPPAYFWNGTPHASTSTRSGLTRAGGEVMKFSDFGFTLIAIIGLGLATPQNVATEYARIDGGYDDYTRKPTRQFTITGRFDGRSYQELRDNRGGLAQLLDRDLIGQDQRLTLLHQVYDVCGRIDSNTSRLICKYQDGLGGNTDSVVAQNVPITFTQYLPNVLSDGESGSALSVQASVTEMDYAAERLANGTWQRISSAFNNAVNGLLYASNGQLYVIGDFTAPQTRVGSWDGTTFSAVGAGLPAGLTVALAESPDGTIYAAGGSAVIGGNTGSVARFTGGAWAIVGATGTMINTVSQLLFARDGTLYAVGNNGATQATLDMWNGTVWANVITHGALSSMTGIAEGFGGILYVGGSFTNLNADANQDFVAQYNPATTTWSALGTGLNIAINGPGLTIGPNGILYITGNFTTAGGVTAPGAAYWNGSSWFAMGAGLTGGNDQGIAQTMPDGSIIVAGNFTGANGVTFPDPIGKWNGGAFVPLDANTPADVATPILGMATSIDGRLAFGYNAAGTATTAATTTVTNTGSARSYPTLIITGPTTGTARIYQCLNVTTNRAIYLNYTMLPGETAKFVFTPDNLSFTSDFQGNIAGKIMPGSNTADFFLQPGANIISCFSADTSVTMTMYWRPAYAGLDDVP